MCTSDGRLNCTRDHSYTAQTACTRDPASTEGVSVLDLNTDGDHISESVSVSLLESGLHGVTLDEESDLLRRPSQRCHGTLIPWRDSSFTLDFTQGSISRHRRPLRECMQTTAPNGLQRTLWGSTVLYLNLALRDHPTPSLTYVARRMRQSFPEAIPVGAVGKKAYSSYATNGRTMCSQNYDATASNEY